MIQETLDEGLGLLIKSSLEAAGRDIARLRTGLDETSAGLTELAGTEAWAEEYRLYLRAAFRTALLAEVGPAVEREEYEWASALVGLAAELE